MGLLKEHSFFFIGLLLSGFAGWLFDRPKQQAELQSSEPDNVGKATHIYRGMIDGLSTRYAKAIANLSEASQRIKELENAVETLLLVTRNK